MSENFKPIMKSVALSGVIGNIDCWGGEGACVARGQFFVCGEGGYYCYYWTAED